MVRIRFRALGQYQLRSPRSSMTAGTRSIRTTVASTSTAVARPNPIVFSPRSGKKTNEANTQTMIAAAAVMTLAVRATPSATAVLAFPVRRYSSRTREIRNTS
ncbi:hypothetical protein D1871_08250 [Nakamurella silvestris]|nr:hypothetical protein D1871_08250 [Nakamurella silvestris]